MPYQGSQLFDGYPGSIAVARNAAFKHSLNNRCRSINVWHRSSRPWLSSDAGVWPQHPPAAPSPTPRACLEARMRGALAQARQRAMLALAEQARLRAGQDQRKERGEIGACCRANLWLLENGQRRVAVIEKGLRIEFDLTRGCCKAARRAVHIRL